MSAGGRNKICVAFVLDKQKRQNKDIFASKRKVAGKQITL